MLGKQLALTKNYRDPVAKLADKLFIDLKFRKNPNATFKDRAAELPISNEVKDVVPLLNMSPEEMNTSFFDSNTVNPEMVLINKPLFSPNCSETSSVSSKESSQLGDLETEMDNICLKGVEQFALFENTLEEKVEENLTTDCKLNKKFMLVGDNVDLLVRLRHILRDRSNRDLHMFHMIAVKNKIPIPEDLIDIRILQIKI